MLALNRGVLVLLMTLLVPQAGISVPDTLTKTDMLKVLYGSFRTLYGDDVRQAFSDKQRYYIHYSRNNFFTDPKGGLNFDAQLGHFPGLHKLMRLWTLDLNYKPSFLNFRKITTVLGLAIGCEQNDLDNAESLASDALKFDTVKFKQIQAELFGNANLTPRQVMDVLGQELLGDIDDQKRQGIIGTTFQAQVQQILFGSNAFLTQDESLYQVKFKKTNVQRYTIKTVDAKLSKFVLTITDNFNADEAVARAKAILDLLEIRYDTIEELVSTGLTFVDETFFENYTPAEVRVKFDDASTILLRALELIQLSNAASEDNAKEATATVSFIVLLLNVYIQYYNDNFDPPYSFTTE